MLMSNWKEKIHKISVVVYNYISWFVSCICERVCVDRDHSVYVPSQWEMTLQCNVISHWLGAYTKWSLIYPKAKQTPLCDALPSGLHCGMAMVGGVIMAAHRRDTWSGLAIRHHQPGLQGEKYWLPTIFQGNLSPLFNPLYANFFIGNIKMYLPFISFLHTDKTRWLKAFLVKDQDLPGPGNARSQGISSHDIYLIKPC